VPVLALVAGMEPTVGVLPTSSNPARVAGAACAADGSIAGIDQFAGMAGLLSRGYDWGLWLTIPLRTVLIILLGWNSGGWLESRKRSRTPEADAR